MNYRYKLEKYKGRDTRYTCPACERSNSFTRYIDTDTNTYLPAVYGKCNRENHCGYHLSPYHDGYARENYKEEKERIKPMHKPIKVEKEVDIPFDLLQSSINPNFYNENQFFQNLIGLLGKEIAEEKAKEYHLGTSKHWQGATVFWFVSQEDKPQAGQIKLFDETNHTVKYIDKYGDKKSKTTWLHYALEQKLKTEKKPIPQWLNDYFQVETKVSCLFGEHLLKKYPEKTIALVEAPKTAIIASAYFPKYLWLAVGALDYLSKERCKALKGRKVVLFPDLKALQKWQERATKHLSEICNYTVNDFLERNAPQAHIEEGYDLADYLSTINYEDFIALSQESKPVTTLPINDKTYLDALFFDEEGILYHGTLQEKRLAMNDLSSPYLSEKTKNFIKLAKENPNVLKLKNLLGLQII